MWAGAALIAVLGVLLAVNAVLAEETVAGARRLREPDYDGYYRRGLVPGDSAEVS